jgi:hypothetical protein
MTCDASACCVTAGAACCFCRTVPLAARKLWTLRILDFDEKSAFDFLGLDRYTSI